MKRHRQAGAESFEECLFPGPASEERGGPRTTGQPQNLVSFRRRKKAATQIRTQLDSLVVQLRPSPIDAPAAPEIIWEERGETRADLPGHEHFGFKDGVSQPGVRGLISRRPKIYLTPRLLKPAGPGEIEFGK